jgi:hypothetical protein
VNSATGGPGARGFQALGSPSSIRRRAAEPGPHRAPFLPLIGWSRNAVLTPSLKVVPCKQQPSRFLCSITANRLTAS